MFSTEIIFLLASMPHIAAWFAHNDNPTDVWSGFYAWSIGYALAFAIDGVSFMLLLAIQRMIKSGHNKSRGVIAGLLFFMSIIALLSVFLNWQYDIQFASNSFAKADAQYIFGLSVGTLNPIIGGAFQVLIFAFALIAKTVSIITTPFKPT